MNKIKTILVVFIVLVVGGIGLALIAQNNVDASLGKQHYLSFTWDAITNTLPYSETADVWKINESVSGVEANIIWEMELTNTSTPNYHISAKDSANLNILRMGDEYVSFGKSVGIGTTTPATTLHLLDTNAQLRIGYDTSNYLHLSVDSDGIAEFTPTGNDPIFQVNGALDILSTAGESFNLLYDDTNYAYLDIADDGELTITASGTDALINLNNRVVANGKTLAGYDATVCASGCDYTSVETAIETESPSTTIRIARGVYNESGAIAVQDNQRLIFDNVEINFTTNSAYFYIDASDVTLEGRLKLTGGRNSGLLYSTDASRRIDAGDCLININPNFGTTYTTWGKGVLIRGRYHQFNFLMHDISFASGDVGHYYAIIDAFNNYYNRISVVINNVTCTGGTGLGRLSGLEVGGTGLYNSYDVVIEGITTDTGNTGKGVQINPNIDYCGFTGAVRNNDGGNFVVEPGATGNNYTAVAD